MYEQNGSYFFKALDQYHKPYLTTLCVSKIVRTEAKDVNLGTNILILLSRWLAVSPFCESLGTSRSRTILTQDAFTKVKHISTMVCTNSGVMPLIMCHLD